MYTGLIKIRPDARGSVAFQTNRNLTLGAGAWAESVPNLEIETNDVGAAMPRRSDRSTTSSASTSRAGALTAVAERLIVLGFFDEVLAQLPLPSLTAELRAASQPDGRQFAVAVGGGRRERRRGHAAACPTSSTAWPTG